MSAPEKLCTKCAEVKPFSLFGAGSRDYPGTVSSACKACLASARAAKRRLNPELHREANKKWRAKDVDKARSRCKVWYEANKESAASNNAAWKAANKEQHLAVQRVGGAQYYQGHKEEAKARARRWELANSDRRRAIGAARRAKLSIPSWARPIEIQAIARKAQALSKSTGVKHHLDHIYPLKGRTVSGLHTPANLRVVRCHVNLRKHNLLPGFLAEELWDPHGPGVFHE